MKKKVKFTCNYAHHKVGEVAELEKFVADFYTSNGFATEDLSDCTGDCLEGCADCSGKKTKKK